MSSTYTKSASPQLSGVDAYAVCVRRILGANECTLVGDVPGKLMLEHTPSGAWCHLLPRDGTANDTTADPGAWLSGFYEPSTTQDNTVEKSLRDVAVQLNQLARHMPYLLDAVSSNGQLFLVAYAQTNPTQLDQPDITCKSGHYLNKPTHRCAVIAEYLTPITKTSITAAVRELATLAHAKPGGTELAEKQTALYQVWAECPRDLLQQYLAKHARGQGPGDNDHLEGQLLRNFQPQAWTVHQTLSRGFSLEL